MSTWLGNKVVQPPAVVGQWVEEVLQVPEVQGQAQLLREVQLAQAGLHKLSG